MLGFSDMNVWKLWFFLTMLAEPTIHPIVVLTGGHDYRNQKPKRTSVSQICLLVEPHLCKVYLHKVYVGL
jgi:hypothetical protein